MKNKINIIFGTTASGKTRLGVELAQKLDGVVINYDSMQIYQEIPIITAQPTILEKENIEHLLYGFIPCTESFSVGRWLEYAIPAIKKTLGRNKTPILVGGTGMYIKSLMDGLPCIPTISDSTKSKVADWKNHLTTQELHEKLFQLDRLMADKLKQNDTQRILRALEVILETGKSLYEWQKEPATPFFPLGDFNIIKIEKPRDVIYKNINQRFLEMVKAGAVDEITSLYNKYGNITYPKACGLTELLSYIKGDITLQEAITKAQQHSRNYAKRQITWMNHQINNTIEIT